MLDPRPGMKINSLETCKIWKRWARGQELCAYDLLTPGLDNTRLFLSLTAGAGTRCMSLLSSSPNLSSDHTLGPRIINWWNVKQIWTKKLLMKDYLGSHTIEIISKRRWHERMLTREYWALTVYWLLNRFQANVRFLFLIFHFHLLFYLLFSIPFIIF